MSTPHHQRPNSRPWPYKPSMTYYNGQTWYSQMTNFNPPISPYQPYGPQPFQATSNLYTERAYLLTSLQREDSRATHLLSTITSIRARLDSPTPLRFRDAKALRKSLAAKRRGAEMSMKQEKWILQRLGHVTFMIQQRERWERVEREKMMGASSGMCNNGGVWGGWDGIWQQAQQPTYAYTEGQQIGEQGWGQCQPQTGFVVELPATPVADSGFQSSNDWQGQTSAGSPGSWQTVSAEGSGSEAAQQSPWESKSDSMAEPVGSGRGAWKRMSVPDLSSGSWSDGDFQYVGYYPRKNSEDLVPK